MKSQTYRVSCYVENKPGVLARIVGLVSGRGYNIQTLEVGPTEDGSVSRMKMEIPGSEPAIEQIVLQLRNQVNVMEASFRKAGR
ncbi:MAG: acetolactate synthase small subunit [Kiritimatiellae bacterium]|nr:acetolactate synthase small subunit [Kiritimatiellia bacterium]